MAKATARSRTPAAGESRFSVAGEVLGLIAFAISALGAVAIASYSATDPVFAMAPVENAAGAVGATLAGLLVGGLGSGAVALVVALAWVGARLVMGIGMPGLSSRFWVGAGALTVALSTLPALLHDLAPGTVAAFPGGIFGDFLIRYERVLFSLWGGLVVNLLFLAVGLLCIAGVSTASVLWAVGAGASAVADILKRASLGLVWGLRRGFELGVGGVRAGFAQLQAGAVSARIWRERRARRARVAAVREPAPEPPEAIPELPPRPPESGESSTPPALPTPRAAKARPAGDAPDIVDHEEERRSKSGPAQEAFLFEDGGPKGPFSLPDVSLFQTPPDMGVQYDRDSLLMNSRILEKKLLDFGVRGKVVRVHPGPVITMYEYEPAAGMKVSKIVNLSDDLAMALRALSIRIIAPLPGKSVVGIEVPNVQREMVYLRTLLEAESFRKENGPLTIAMGKDIFGNCVEADLAKMPHLLVAGATGTGKSVFLNSVLCSILSRVTPDECKLLLIDPKLLEMSLDEGIPHLIADVVTQPKRAAAALAGIVRKMEERYMMMSALQVRNIDQFNKKAAAAIENGETHFRLRAPAGEEGMEVPYRKLPYIVVVIDELADLMVQVARDVEEALQRLAQMARAAGIHLILATQRPSVDVLTGVIKANFPARVSFQVSSRTDSRTVLDQNGADNLLGQGDMLFLPPGTSRLQRLHGPFVSEDEVSEVVSFLREQGAPEFDEGLIRVAAEGEAADEGDEEVDEYFDRAVAIVAETRNASISYIQRRLKVGYNRAARIVEQMERDAMVGPQEGTKPREVYLRSSDAEDAAFE